MPAAVDAASLEAFESIVRKRRSVRAFLPDRVPEEKLRGLFELAQHAPSNCNVQPWSVHVTSGATTDRLRAELISAVASGAPADSDFEGLNAYPGAHRDRQIGAARALYGAMGIARHDSEARQRAMLRNFAFFDAPHVAFLFVPDWAKARDIADCGIYAQTLMLAMTAQGIASCPQAALAQYSGIVRTILNVSAPLKLLFGISFGYEDPQAAANLARTDRVPFDQAVRFHD